MQWWWSEGLFLWIGVSSWLQLEEQHYYLQLESILQGELHASGSLQLLMQTQLIPVAMILLLKFSLVSLHFLVWFFFLFSFLGTSFFLVAVVFKFSFRFCRGSQHQYWFLLFTTGLVTGTHWYLETSMSEVHQSALNALLYWTTSNQSWDIFLVLATNWPCDHLDSAVSVLMKFWNFHYYGVELLKLLNLYLNKIHCKCWKSFPSVLESSDARSARHAWN